MLQVRVGPFQENRQLHRVDFCNELGSDSHESKNIGGRYQLMQSCEVPHEAPRKLTVFPPIR